MSINDIMVGFWVSYKGIPHKIKKIMGTEVVLDKPGIESDEEYIMADIADCKPVKVTNEILVESGFFESKGKFVLDDGSSMLLITYDEETDNYSLFIGLCNLALHITYVHELQQILKAHKNKMAIDLNRNNCDYKIGNWVIIDNQIYQIESWIESVDMYTLNHMIPTEPGTTSKKDAFQPIHVNSDIFKFNGFTETSDKSFIKMKTDEYMITCGKDSVWKIINSSTNESYVGYVQYLHQLQNICSMLKIEVELKPFSDDKILDDMLDEISK
jgi:hypothetical protein